jgi:hypothetical protein
LHEKPQQSKRGRRAAKIKFSIAALILAPRENFCLAGNGQCVVTTTLNIAKKFVADVLHTRLADIPAG